jgi:hypothetical protein
VPGRPPHEVAEVFRNHLAARPRSLRPRWSPQQARVVSRILACRTAALGGHIRECDGCRHREISYNSCRDRHCPKCQGSAQADWLQARQADVLPVPYAHVVFTLPATLAPLALAQPRVVYDLLLKTVASTLQDVARNPRHLGARLGFFAVLHTWGQTLVHHPHVHCVVPAGGLSDDGRAWHPCRPGFFLPVRVLSRLFRGRFLAGLHNAFDARLLGDLDPHFFARLLDSARETEWVVYAKPPFDGPASVLAYLARYTHRVAISNARLLHVDERSVTFRYKDYRSRRARRLTLPLAEFVRRFLLHILPPGFMRIRYYGLLANGCRARLLALCRTALDRLPDSSSPSTNGSTDFRDLVSDLLPPYLVLCPSCKHATMRCVQVLERPPPSAWSIHVRL